MSPPSRTSLLSVTFESALKGRKEGREGERKEGRGKGGLVKSLEGPGYGCIPSAWYITMELKKDLEWTPRGHNQARTAFDKKSIHPDLQTQRGKERMGRIESVALTYVHCHM